MFCLWRVHTTNGRVDRGRADRQPLPKSAFESSASNPWFVGSVWAARHREQSDLPHHRVYVPRTDRATFDRAPSGLVRPRSFEHGDRPRVFEHRDRPRSLEQRSSAHPRALISTAHLHAPTRRTVAFSRHERTGHYRPKRFLSARLQRLVRPLLRCEFGLHYLDDDTIRISNNEVNAVWLRWVDGLGAVLDCLLVSGVKIVNLQENQCHRVFRVFEHRWFVRIRDQRDWEISDP